MIVEGIVQDKTAVAGLPGGLPGQVIAAVERSQEEGRWVRIEEI